ncbi:MAG: SpoIIE family protein phosphatase [SAR324 cluster bacterium]|nr:SpoIIE family protein phosphatase [SAR324 cluster bacterium]
MSEIEKKHKILVVDDQRLNIHVLSKLLQSDYKIMAAKNGEQALKAAQLDSPPDLILLDIMMPDMDGYEVCRRLKENNSTRDIPIIFVSAMDETGDETKGLELGAVDYIIKPFSPPIVLARVKAHLLLKKSMDELNRAYEIIEAQKLRMESELNVGYEIQKSRVPMNFPPFPDRTEFSIFGALKPAREVGGDFYDFYFLDENRLCVCIGDAAGKGVPSALFMAETKILIKSWAKYENSTAGIITRINTELSQDNQTYMFVTLFIGILNIDSGLFQYTNAGHNPPILKRYDGTVQLLNERHGPVIGAVEGLDYRQDTIQLEQLDLLLMFTDGVTEAKSPSGELYTDKRLAELVSSGQFQSPEDLVKMVVSEIKQYESPQAQTDDITVLSIQLLNDSKEDDSQRLELTVENKLSELERIQSHFKTFSEQNRLTDPIRRTLSTVLDEMLSNIIHYAYEDQSGHEIKISFERTVNQLSVRIEDEGTAFNPLSVKAPDLTKALDDREVGGLGIHLVRKMMDQCEYERKNNKNIITLLKLIPDDDKMM